MLYQLTRSDALAIELVRLPASRKIAANQKHEFPLLGLVPQVRVQDSRQTVSATEQEEIDKANSLRQYGVDLLD